MAALTGISVDEYLHSVYEPDYDYVEGEVLDRNVGEIDHSSLQFLLIGLLTKAAASGEIRIKPELRMRLTPTRYRVPDILVMRSNQPYEPVLTAPPFLCIEIVSPEDPLSRITEKVRDYLRFGVEYVWVIDPQTEIAWQYSADTITEAKEFLTTTGPDLAISLPKLFADLESERGPVA